MRHRLASGRSHSGSTGCNRPPGGQNVTCRIDVPIQDQRTTFTPEYPFTQRHRRLHLPTARARFAAWQPAIHDNYPTIMPTRLVLEHRPQLRPGRITDRAGQTVIPKQVGDRQILDHDRLVLTNEPSTHLVKEITPPINDPSMDPSHPRPCLGPVVGTSLFAGQSALRLDQRDTLAPLMSGVGNRPVHVRQTRDRPGQGEQTTHPSIDADLTVIGWPAWHCDLHEYRHVPSASWIPRHGHRGRHRTRWEWTRPANRQRFGHLRQCELPVTVAEAGTGVLRRCPGLLARFEPRIAGSPVEEAGECLLQVPQALLQRHTGHHVQKRQVLAAFPTSQQSRRLGIAGTALLTAPRCGSGFQSHVVHEPDTTEGPRQRCRLTFGGIETIPEGPFDQCCRHKIQPNAPTDNSRTLVRVVHLVLVWNNRSVPPRHSGRGIDQLECR